MVFLHRDKIKTEQIVKSLNLKISARDSRHTDSRVHLKALFDQWLPLSRSMLTVVVEKLPNPQEISDERVEKLMCSGLRTFDSLPEETQRLKNGECFLYLSLSLFFGLWLFPVVVGWFVVAVIDAFYLPSVVHSHTALLVLSFSFLGVYASRISTLLALLWLFIP